MKSVVTGGAGFIGSNLVDQLVKLGHQVIVLDNLSTGQLSNLVQVKNKIEFVNVDISKSEDSIHKYFDNVDWVFHVAGLADMFSSILNPNKYFQSNVIGTLNVLEASKKAKVKKFIYAASASCYGINEKIIKEDSHINLEHPYALSKYLGEKAVFHWNKVYGLSANSIRIFNAYGPRVRTTGAYGAVIGVFFKQKIKNKPLTIVGDGKQSRDFVHVTDVVKAFLAAAKTTNVGKIYNVGTGKPQTVNYLSNLVGGRKVFIPNRPGEPKCSCAGIGRIKRELKWKPKIKFEDGITEMLNEIEKWEDAPLWTPKKIRKATKTWFSYLSKK